MSGAVTLDSFQLIVGAYLIYVACKGSGTLYNFVDVPEEKRPSVRRSLRLTYALCGLLALADAGVCIWFNASGSGLISERAVTFISSGLVALIAVILIAVFIRLRKLSAGK